MPPEVIAKAFEPFFTTKSPGKGTGLGLSQVYGFVKQSHGHIKIYSEPGTGTTIKIYLPRYFGEDETARRRPRSLEPTGGKAGEVILVAEDEDHVREMVCDSLREVGYTVIGAADAEQALRLLQERPDVALLLTDIVMPRMNGRVLAEEAQRTRPGLKVLYTTGFTRNAVVHNGVLDAGVNLIVKPFTVEQLAAKVREVLDGA
jgi:CheY-like chemotaxis protein